MSRSDLVSPRRTFVPPTQSVPLHDMEATIPLLSEQTPSPSSSLESSPTAQKFNLVPPMWVLMMVIVIAWFVAGVIVGVKCEGWPVVTALYVMVQIITTVGYGDLTMHSQEGKLMMSLQVLIGIVIVATIVANLVHQLLAIKLDIVHQGLRKMEARLEGHDEEDQISKKYRAMNRLVASTAVFGVFMMAGMLFFGVTESCICLEQKRGRMVEIEGCIEGPKCAKTGGLSKTWIDVFYMSVITVTTVGFGDYMPVRKSGQIFAIFWMLLGTLSLGNFVAAFTEYFLESQPMLEPISREVFDSIDKDKNGHLSKVEFRSYALVKLGFCTQEELDQVDNMFSRMDRDNTGCLTYEEIHSSMDPPSPRGLA